ncbi:tetratricopeptide repeat-containing sensor histidine kinase [Chitinophaga vietnamensis]|uniref:tetratricopeptide repeat-containing sensor histidine kinase n=1 Tax=Chitinophaga vietnamensis TaxID=2593957 RepID=UPI001F1B7928|nr:tetratricopeptide repeat-containing sensor histidine kinase [Chitinophaga vietnamensis]
MRTLLFLLALAACLLACNKKHVVVPFPQDPDFAKGDAFLYTHKDSAFYYFYKVVSDSRDSLQIAMAYNRMAVIQSDEGDYFGSQESLLMSLRHLDEKNPRDSACLASDYNELGTTSLNLKNYDAAIHYDDLALNFTSNDGFKLIFLNNKAVAYQKKRDFASAIAIYDDIINKHKGDKLAYARALSNWARTKWLQDSSYKAAPELWTALQIRINEKDLWGQNASYSHLSDYYSRTRPDSALTYADKMYAIARQLNSPDDELEALQKLLLLALPQDMRQYFERYQFLNDSLQTARNNAKNQFALIRYDAQKNRMENLQLQKENAYRKLQIIQQRMMIYGGILLVVLGVFIAAIWYRKRKQSIIREQALKDSKKVHDVVANGLYYIITAIEHNGIMNEETLLDKLEDLYEKSRNISYEQSENNNEAYHDEIAKLLGVFKTETTAVLTVGNNEALWENTSKAAQTEVKYILQELMVNMKKHSAANKVFIKFEKNIHEIKICYTDDGIGFSPEFRPGNGLKNTVSRISGIGGNVKFVTDVVKGAKILISFPI